MSLASEDLKLTQTIKNIVREIEREFIRLKDKYTDKSLITFYVKLLLYDPNWQIDGEVLLAREKIQKLINRVVDDFHRIQEPDMVTINIQNCLLNTFQRRYEILDNKRNNTAQRLNPLRLAILELDTTTHDLTNVFHKILVYCILASGMGNPLKPEVYKQSRSVLRSILTMDELRTFLNIPYVIRLEELNKMIKVYTGIRIYNNDCGRGGEGLPGLPRLLFTAIDGLNDYLIYLFYETVEKIEILTNAISNCYVPLMLKQNIWLKMNIPENECLFEEDIKYCIHLILVYKQFQEALQYLLEEVGALEKCSKQDEVHFQNTLEHLHENVVPNFYIHVNLVFPYFIKLSDTWANFQDTITIMNVIREVAQNIDKMVKSLKFDNNLIKYTSHPSKIRYSEAAVSLQNVFGDAHSECEVIKKEDLEATMNTKDENLVFEYEGHCCWTLVMTNGFLIKGNSKHGIVRFNKRYYIFSSPVALKCFSINPPYFINNVLQLARNRCGFINFLKLSADLISVKDNLNLIHTDIEDSQVGFAEVSCQADSESESYIDRTYHFSLWKYKADALKMATVRRYKTQGTMTTKTFFKNSMHSQTYLKREKDNITRAEKYTNTPKPLVFLQGLRGDVGGKKEAQLNLTYWDFKPSYYREDK